MTTTEALDRVAARATDLQARNQRDAAQFASTEDRYALGLAQGYADAAGLLLELVEDLKTEAAR